MTNTTIDMLSDEQIKKAEKYIKENGAKSKYMTREEMSEMTGLSDAECKAVMKHLVKNGTLRMEYAIYCPKCGKLTDKSPVNHTIHLSGYTCPWCGERVDFKHENLGKLYAPRDIETIKKWKGF